MRRIYWRWVHYIQLYIYVCTHNVNSCNLTWLCEGNDEKRRLAMSACNRQGLSITLLEQSDWICCMHEFWGRRRSSWYISLPEMAAARLKGLPIHIWRADVWHLLCRHNHQEWGHGSIYFKLQRIGGDLLVLDQFIERSVYGQFFFWFISICYNHKNRSKSKD